MSKKDKLENFICVVCLLHYPEVEPYFQTRGEVRYMRPLCKRCDNHRRRDYGFSPQEREAGLVSSRKYQKSLRTSTDHTKIAKVISQDCKAQDRQRGGCKNDLNSAWVADQIKDGCCYCGDTAGRMGLDRVDNALPHNMNNVVPACLRCNLTRGGMPYEAWRVVSVNMRVAREAGLFGTWDGRLRSYRSTE